MGSLKHFVQFSILKYCNVYSQFVITYANDTKQLYFGENWNCPNSVLYRSLQIDIQILFQDKFWIRSKRSLKNCCLLLFFVNTETKMASTSQTGNSFVNFRRKSKRTSKTFCGPGRGKTCRTFQRESVCSSWDGGATSPLNKLSNILLLILNMPSHWN